MTILTRGLLFFTKLQSRNNPEIMNSCYQEIILINLTGISESSSLSSSLHLIHVSTKPHTVHLLMNLKPLAPPKGLIQNLALQFFLLPVRPSEISHSLNIQLTLIQRLEVQKYFVL